MYVCMLSSTCTRIPNIPQVRRRGCWVGRQPGFPKELLARRGPGGVGEKEVLEFAKPLAARDPHVPTLDLIPQGGQHGTFIGAAIGGAIGPDKGPEPFGNTGERQVRREGTVAGGIEVTEDLDSLQKGGGAGRLQGDREVGEEAGRKLAEVTLAFHHEGKDLTGVAGQPVVGVLELTLQALRRNVLKHRRADRVR